MGFCHKLTRPRVPPRWRPRRGARWCAAAALGAGALLTPIPARAAGAGADAAAPATPERAQRASSTRENNADPSRPARSNRDQKAAAEDAGKQTVRQLLGRRKHPSAPPDADAEAVHAPSPKPATNTRQAGAATKDQGIKPYRPPGTPPGSAASQNPWDAAVLGPLPGQAPPRLLREGSFIVSRAGRLLRPRRRPQRVFVFDNPAGKPSLPPVLLLPCRYVQSMEDAVEKDKASIKFTVSGQVTAFRGVNYLLVTDLTGVRTGAQSVPGRGSDKPKGSRGDKTPAAASKPAEPSEPSGAKAKNAPRRSAGAGGSGGSGASDASGAKEAGAVVRELLAKRDHAPAVALPAPPGDADQPGAGADAVAGTAPPSGADASGKSVGKTKAKTSRGGSAPRGGRRPGAILVNRVGYLRSSANGAGAMFVFEADTAANPEPPVILQPCRLLAEVEDMLAQRGQPVRLLLSGEIQKYRGADYLLPTVIRAAPLHGNLQP